MLSESSWHLDLTPNPSPGGRGEPEGVTPGRVAAMPLNYPIARNAS